MSALVVSEESETTKDSAASLPPIVLLLQLADEMKVELNAGRNRSEIAERHGVSRPRATQILNLLELHPAILNQLRGLGPGTPVRLVTERRLRTFLKLTPDDQLTQWEQFAPDLATELFQVGPSRRALTKSGRRLQRARSRDLE